MSTADIESATTLYSVGGPERVAVGVAAWRQIRQSFLHDHTLIPADRFRTEAAGKHIRHIKLREIPPYRDAHGHASNPYCAPLQRFKPDGRMKTRRVYV